MENDFTISETGGVRIVEGPPDRPVMRTVDDAALVVETCFSHRALSALLYAENLTEHFFDLSSGEAGAVLQKLRNYRIRVAVVYSPDRVRFSTKFGELVTEENRGNHFRLFESAEAAREWLSTTR
ncbi:MAG TPA: DUF4180 domain-containing protein [Bryobacteraceae bacterium]|nr:DUF4180 domain-containing protein [Bryobacteraceae bacterium]